MSLSNPKVYVAGAYSGDNIQNIKTAIREGDWLMSYGFVPFIPHLTGLWDLVSTHEYDEWMKYDMEWLSVCDALLRLPGKSSGADKEVQFATEHKIPVFYDSKDLVEYFGKVW